MFLASFWVGLRAGEISGEFCLRMRVGGTSVVFDADVYSCV